MNLPHPLFQCGFHPLSCSMKLRSQNKPILKHRAILLRFVKYLVKTVDDINLSF